MLNKKNMSERHRESGLLSICWLLALSQHYKADRTHASKDAGLETNNMKSTSMPLTGQYPIPN